MSDAWGGVIGAAIGGVIVVLGQRIVQRRVDWSTRRRERRETYVDFIEASNHGIRIGRSLRDLDHEVTASWSSSPADPDDLKTLQRELKEVRAVNAQYMRAMDRARGAVQITAPMTLSSAASGCERHLTITHNTAWGTATSTHCTLGSSPSPGST